MCLYLEFLRLLATIPSLLCSDLVYASLVSVTLLASLLLYVYGCFLSWWDYLFNNNNSRNALSSWHTAPGCFHLKVWFNLVMLSSAQLLCLCFSLLLNVQFVLLIFVNLYRLCIWPCIILKWPWVKVSVFLSFCCVLAFTVCLMLAIRWISRHGFYFHFICV